MQFKNLDEIKDFILWAKDQGIKDIAVGELKCTISDIELVRLHTNKYESQDTSQANYESQNPRVENMKNQTQENEERDLLFWSTGI